MRSAFQQARIVRLLADNDDMDFTIVSATSCGGTQASSGYCAKCNAVVISLMSAPGSVMGDRLCASCYGITKKSPK